MALKLWHRLNCWLYPPLRTGLLAPVMGSEWNDTHSATIAPTTRKDGLLKVYNATTAYFEGKSGEYSKP